MFVRKRAATVPLCAQSTDGPKSQKSNNPEVSGICLEGEPAATGYEWRQVADCMSSASEIQGPATVFENPHQAHPSFSNFSIFSFSTLALARELV